MKKKLAITALVFLFFSLVIPARADTVPGSLDTGFDPGTGLDTDLMLNLSVARWRYNPTVKSSSVVFSLKLMVLGITTWPV